MKGNGRAANEQNPDFSISCFAGRKGLRIKGRRQGKRNHCLRSRNRKSQVADPDGENQRGFPVGLGQGWLGKTRGSGKPSTETEDAREQIPDMSEVVLRR